MCVEYNISIIYSIIHDDIERRPTYAISLHSRQRRPGTAKRGRQNNIARKDITIKSESRRCERARHRLLFTKLIKYVLRAIKNEIFDRRRRRRRSRYAYCVVWCCCISDDRFRARVDLSKIDCTTTLAYTTVLSIVVVVVVVSGIDVKPFTRVCFSRYFTIRVQAVFVRFPPRGYCSYGRSAYFTPLNVNGK